MHFTEIKILAKSNSSRVASIIRNIGNIGCYRFFNILFQANITLPGNTAEAEDSCNEAHDFENNKSLDLDPPINFFKPGGYLK